MKNTQQIKSTFNENEWRMIRYIALFGKGDLTWETLSDLFHIKPFGDTRQKTKGANDVWRKFKKRTEKQGYTLDEIIGYFIVTEWKK